ncbi:Aste57867_13871 [Aphanomyces stellatus]|uniref:Aste57867_13871 protein n=1 Tax=Aphanomyces stellatus TaxID=120398 RepID=A0A485KZL5_9STRA|nr:hypothetical protein As57867_013820 [Aphanomyces stellatus]VFT90702.1 Aste57867_13871 [Aphanomyces stellatus]
MSTTMRALVYSAHGAAADALSIKSVPRPAPAANQVLVKVAAAAVNKGDHVVLGGAVFLVRLAAGRVKPDTKIGSDFAGTVEAVGSNVTAFRVGDAVFGQTNVMAGQGSFAEFICMGESDAIALKPSTLSFEEAACMPVAAQTALQALRDDGLLQPGQSVLINGASGGVGSFAIQIAKALGASHVTAVCSAANADAARALGADAVVDYAKEDFTANPLAKFDLLLDLVGNRSLRDSRRVLAPHGTYVTAGGPPETFMSRLMSLLALKPFVGQRLVVCMLAPSQALLKAVKTMTDVGQMKPVISARFDFVESVKAFELFEQGHLKGKIVVALPGATS